jgi:hypothetical protein
MVTAMDVDHPEDDQRWDSRARGETEPQRLERSWKSLLQELRVVQTGVTIIIFDAASGTVVATVAGASALALLVLFWIVLPFSLRNRDVEV